MQTAPSVACEFGGGKREVRQSDSCGRDVSLYLGALLLLRDSARDADAPSVACEFGGGKRVVTSRALDPRDRDESVRERTCLGTAVGGWWLAVKWWCGV